MFKIPEIKWSYRSHKTHWPWPMKYGNRLVYPTSICIMSLQTNEIFKWLFLVSHFAIVCSWCCGFVLLLNFSNFSSTLSRPLPPQESEERNREKRIPCKHRKWIHSIHHFHPNVEIEWKEPNWNADAEFLIEFVDLIKMSWINYTGAT